VLAWIVAGLFVLLPMTTRHLLVLLFSIHLLLWYQCCIGSFTAQAEICRYLGQERECPSFVYQLQPVARSSHVLNAFGCFIAANCDLFYLMLWTSSVLRLLIQISIPSYYLKRLVARNPNHNLWYIDRTLWVAMIEMCNIWLDIYLMGCEGQLITGTDPYFLMNSARTNDVFVCFQCWFSLGSVIFHHGRVHFFDGARIARRIVLVGEFDSAMALARAATLLQNLWNDNNGKSRRGPILAWKVTWKARRVKLKKKLVVSLQNLARNSDNNGSINKMFTNDCEMIW
jgi:hypothetical protein